MSHSTQSADETCWRGWHCAQWRSSMISPGRVGSTSSQLMFRSWRCDHRLLASAGSLPQVGQGSARLPWRDDPRAGGAAGAAVVDGSVAVGAAWFCATTGRVCWRSVVSSSCWAARRDSDGAPDTGSSRSHRFIATAGRAPDSSSNSRSSSISTGIPMASSSCLKMIVAQLMLVCSVVKYSGLLGLSCRCGGNDFVPDREAGGHLGSPLGCTDQMTTGPKVLPDVAESKQEPLSLPR